jgi:outer membrane protein assembly factor BamB
MKTKRSYITKSALVLWAFGMVSAVVGQSRAHQQKAEQILDTTNVKGGLVVHVGCGDGKLTAALRAGDSYLVHGLDSDADNVRQARQYIQSLGIYGNVAVDRFDGKHLPYIDNLVNLVVAEDLGSVAPDEVMRVLCPQGVAYIKHGNRPGSWPLRGELGLRRDEWTKRVKPRPDKIDEWTHYLYDATGNAVSHDMVVGPPRHFQWTGGPRWSRHHDRRSSISAMVSAGNRIFYIFDEGSIASIMLPPKTVLVARDAFNGTTLWKRPIAKWHPHLWPLKSGPTQLQRRLVAVGDRVYVTLNLDAPLVALDAASGKTVRTYEGSFATEEVLASNGVLFLLVNESPQVYDDFRPEEVGIGKERDRVMRDWPWNEKPRHILAVQADSGKVLWKKDYRVVPVTLAVDDKRVYFHDGRKVVALNRKTGEQAWSSGPVERRETIPTNITPTLVVYEDTVLFYGATRKLTGLSAETGEILWTQPHPRSGHYCPEDVLVAGGLVWGGEIAGGRDSGEFIGRHPRTGEIKSQFPPDIDIFFMHQRCYRSKATERFLLPSWTGIEFIDFRAKHWVTHHWVRSGCIYGIMPCNGLVYTTAHDCACYLQAKLYGFCALAPEKDDGREGRGERKPAPRLERPPGGVVAGGISGGRDADWPTYRHDGARSGFTPAPVFRQEGAGVPADLEQSWKRRLGGRLSAPVLAGGKLFVASIDTHTVHALDADSGEPMWSYTAGGRIDSPPTIWRGLVLFGSADSHVYCLRASDGAFVWRFRAAPEDRRMTSFEQVESVWPVHGSVLVEDGVVYCVAGRSMFLDGGLRYLRLDAMTGRKLGETIFDERDPKTGENLQVHVKVRNMPVGLPDVLSTDGEFVYMRSQRFDVEGNRYDLAPLSGKDAEQGAVQKGEGVHLFSPTGFLDGSWLHRSYWVYGRTFAEGAGGWPHAGRNAPGGRILAFDDSNVYGFGRKPLYYRWRTPLEYHLFCTSKDPEIVRQPVTLKTAKGQRKLHPQHPEYKWSRSVPLLVRAMVLADNTLFIVGPPDVVDEEEAFRRVGDPEMQAQLAAQDAAMAGEKGALRKESLGLLWAVSAENGEKLTECRLEELPVFDGMAAAGGRLYLATTEGAVLCFAGTRQPENGGI